LSSTWLDSATNTGFAFDYADTATKAVTYKSPAFPTEFRLILAKKGVTAAFYTDGTTQKTMLEMVGAGTVALDREFSVYKWDTTTNAFVFVQQYYPGDGVNINFPNLSCVDSVRNPTYSRYGVAHVGTFSNLFRPYSGTKVWAGSQYDPPPPPPPTPEPEPNTELTLRDQKIIALGVTGFLIYLVTKPFGFRQHE
jgi:hypothetical protein